MRIALLHGWGFDRSLWDKVIPLLGEFACAADDRGYFGDPEPPAAADLVVGHSLGTMRALLAPPPGALALVAINGFDRFAAASDFPAGVAPRVLDRMLARVSGDAAGVVAQFRARCGVTAGFGQAHPGPLAADLAILRGGDGRGQWQGPLARLDGADDPILLPAHRAACFADRADVAPEEVAGHGHLLPLTAPERCAAAIRAMARQLA